MRQRLGQRARELACTRAAEVFACAACLTAVAAVMCAAHVRHGGLYYDDWGVLALNRAHPAGGLLHALWLDYGQRPAQVLYYAGLDRLLGTDAAARLALAAAMLALECTCLYALLRRVGLATHAAGAIALLALTFPFSDSLWLWGILSLASLSIAAALLGLVLALRALEHRGTKAFVLHGASLALYVSSLLSYELFAVAGCLAGLLYARAAGLRRARARWALDVLVIGATLLFERALLPVDVATPSRAQSLAGTAAHSAAMARDGLRLLGRATVPVTRVSPWLGCALIAIVLAAAAALRRRLPPREPLRRELSGLLGLAGAGALVALAAWAVYAPAPSHYSPLAGGTVNRVNAAAAIGVAALIYALLALLARLLGVVLRLPRFPAAAVSAALVLILVLGYIERSGEDRRAWDLAAGEQRRELARLRPLLARLPAGATVFATGAPRQLAPGVPVLGTTLDLTSAVRIALERPLLVAVPVTSAADADCGVGGPSAADVRAAYGRSYLAEPAARRLVVLTGPEQCAAATRRRSEPAPAPVTIMRRAGARGA